MIKKPSKFKSVICVLSEDMVEDLNTIAKDFGMTRIGIIRMILSEGIKSYYNFNRKGGEENAMHETNDQS